MADVHAFVKNEVDDFYDESQDDYIGLWQIVSRARDHSDSEKHKRDIAFGIIRLLLGRGLHVGNLVKTGGFASWNEQDPDFVIGRIGREWDQLGHDPTIDDIAWFWLPEPESR